MRAGVEQVEFIACDAFDEVTYKDRLPKCELQSYRGYLNFSRIISWLCVRCVGLADCVPEEGYLILHNHNRGIRNRN